MTDKYYNGQKWENLTLKLIDLASPLGEVLVSQSTAWQPLLPTEEPTQAAWDAWHEIEGGHRESVHEAARALIRTERVPAPTPEIVYFLGLRLRAALAHVETLFAMQGERPVSLLAFPALPPDEVVEWLLTEWADYHAVTIVFPELANL